MPSCHVHPLPYHSDPSCLFAIIHEAPGAVMLDSGRPIATRGRYDLMSAWPLAELAPLPDESANRFFARLREAAGSLGPAQLPAPYELPFAGGLLGYLSYDLGRRIERIGEHAREDRFLKLGKGKVETRPIKGTRPRGKTPEEDMALAASLLASPKDRAENLMIVDLLRNDIGRSCQPGSVRVPELFALESYPNVHHLVSSVTGELAPGKDALDLLEGSFPGGSITGAPKIRAMQIIDELEPSRRGIYCGSLFYLDVRGEMDSSIAIRTLLVRNGQVSCWGGGGIVADSHWEDEYQETLDKVRVLLETLEGMAGTASPE